MLIGICRFGAISAHGVLLIRWFLPVPRSLRGSVPAGWWMTEPGTADRTEPADRWRNFCMALDLFDFARQRFTYS